MLTSLCNEPLTFRLPFILFFHLFLSLSLSLVLGLSRALAYRSLSAKEHAKGAPSTERAWRAEARWEGTRGGKRDHVTGHRS